jgi:hypothetical protein
VQVEGRDNNTGEPVIVDSYDWEWIEKGIDRPLFVRDRNIGSEETAAMRGESDLRKAEMFSTGGVIRVPFNCGQELYDVVEISETFAGLSETRRRVLGIESIYDTRRGIYEQKLRLGGV